MNINGNLKVETISGSSTQGNIVVHNSSTKELESRTTLPQSAITNLTTDLSNKQPLDSTLTSLAGYNTNGIMVQTATDTFTGRSLQQPSAGITIGNANGVAGNPNFALANDLNALEGLAGTGFAVRTATDTWAQRTITGTAGQINVSFGDGVSSNPLISLNQSVIDGSSIFSGGTGTNSIISLVGTDAIASNTQAISIGHSSQATGVNGVALGGTALSLGNGAVAIGGTSAGANNTVSIGSDNSIDGIDSIGIGQNNLTGVPKSILIGKNNLVLSNNGITIGESNTSSAIFSNSIGFGNTASGGYSNAIGAGASATRVGEFAYQIDPSNVHNSQYGWMMYNGTTTNATPTELTLANTGSRFTIPVGRAYLIRIMAIARHNGTGVIKSWTATASIKNQAGTTTLVQNALTVLANEAALGTATFTLTGNNTNDAFQIAVTGVASVTISWSFVCEYIQVS